MAGDFKLPAIFLPYKNVSGNSPDCKLIGTVKIYAQKRMQALGE